MENSVKKDAKRILVICPFPEGMAPAQRLKYEQYFDTWRENGYQVDVSPFTGMKLYNVLWENGHYVRKILGAVVGTFRRIMDLFHLHKYDITYVFLWVTPLGPPLSEWMVRKLSKKLIYDIDDNVHLGQNLPGQYNPNPLLRFLKGKGKPLYMMKHADYVICSSPFLEAESKKRNKNAAAKYITSSVDTGYFVPRKKRPPNKKVIIGWTGTFSSRPFLDMIAPSLQKLSKKRDFEFRIIGNFDYEMAEVDLEVIRFEKATEIEDLCHFDIGIYPLPDDPWVLGKSGLKAIVYMAMGIPVVASAVGSTPLLYEHGDIGFMIENTDDAWMDALARLVDDAGMRKRLGKNARKIAAEHYSRAAVAKQYDQVLRIVSQ